MGINIMGVDNARGDKTKESHGGGVLLARNN
jgi:hypothetical protein